MNQNRFECGFISWKCEQFYFLQNNQINQMGYDGIDREIKNNSRHRVFLEKNKDNSQKSHYIKRF